MRKVMVGLLVLFAAVSFVACENDSYDSGTGEYSLLRGDFAEATTDHYSQIVSFVTDDNVEYTLTTASTEDWATRADTTYRTMLYYNKVGDGQAELFSIAPVSVLNLIPRDSLNEVFTDPINLESVWMSKNGKYLNIGFYVKTGEVVDTVAVLQSVGIILDSLRTNPDGTKAMMLSLYHDQGTIPEYYSRKYYLSIRRSSLVTDSKSNSLPDSIYFTANTYEGEKHLVISE